MQPVGFHIGSSTDTSDKNSSAEDAHDTLRIPLASYGDTAFCRAMLTLHPLKMASIGRVAPWNYELRQQAQAILPFLYLGPAARARDLTFLQQTGITFLLAVRTVVPDQASSAYMNPAPVAAKLGIECWTLDAQNAFEVRQQLMTAVARINEHLERSSTAGMASGLEQIRGRLLVYCETGNDRSATLVAAYLIVMYNLDAPSALALMQSKRFCLCPTDAMKVMLAEFRRYVEAEGQVAIAQQADQEALQLLQTLSIPDLPALQLSSPRKRQLSDMYEQSIMEVTMPEAKDDLGGGQSREGLAPFADV